MLLTLVPLFDENMAVCAYSFFTQRENFLLNPLLLGTAQFDGASQITGLELIQKIQHILHLCITAQEAGVYAIKGLVHLNPFPGDLIHFVCIIIIKIAVKTCLG